MVEKYFGVESGEGIERRECIVTLLGELEWNPVKELKEIMRRLGPQFA